jgi:futalosine hydrolase
MYILLASATYNEINITAEWLRGLGGGVNGNEVEVVVTGIGSAITAYGLSKKISQRRPDIIIQAGIGGSFREELPPGSACFVDEEVLADLGAIDGGGFADIFDLGLADSNDEPFRNRVLPNPYAEKWKAFGLPFVRGATINCISSTPVQAQMIARKYDPAVESMEGAALHYVCLMESVPFIQLRAVSNFAGERDKRNWKLQEAIGVLNEKVREMLLLGKS